MGAAVTVLEVTGDAVQVLPGRGSPATAPPVALVNAALEWIDEPYGLLDERPVRVADLWRSLAVTLLGERCESVVVLHPPDWPRHRVERVVAAVNTVAGHVEAFGRDRWLGEAFGRDRWRGEAPDDDWPVSRVQHPRRPVIALAAGIAVALPVAVWVARPESTAASPVTVVEGRMAVGVPAPWIVERVTGGPGSRRLEVSPPGDPGIALHLTSAYAPESTLEQAAAALSSAIDAESPEVFVALNPHDDVGGRPAVTYREVRPGRVIAWSVVLDGATRISVGCQSPPGREQDVRVACEDAVRTARQK